MHCAIDFGTSNSAVALPAAGGARSTLVPLEAGQGTMPTAVFYAVEEAALPEVAAPGDPYPRCYGRAALAAYVDGIDGRLMRSMKSLLGSSLAEQRTDVGAGRSVAYLDVIAGYLHHLRRRATEVLGTAPERAVLGRPVFFVDDDPQRDALAQSSLADAARQVGFREVVFQYEPIAAALDHEQQARREELVLVADIGGGTSDFSLVRVGPARHGRVERHDDILASHGVHVAGTDFDRRIELKSILPWCGFGAHGPEARGRPAREVPNKVYFDLATWHLINTVYAPQRVAELRRMRDFYADPAHHARLMRVVTQRLGHALASAAEAAKIDVAEGRPARIDLDLLEDGLQAALSEAEAVQAIDAEMDRIVAAAVETLRLAGVQSGDVDALYFTGGSTGFSPLVDRIAAVFPMAQRVQGDRHASVAQGLGVHADLVFGRGG